MTTKKPKRRRSMGTDPLEALVSKPTEEKESPGTTPEPPTKSKRSTYHLDPDLVEELKDAAMHFAGPPEYATLSGLVSKAIRAELDRLRKKHLGGEEIPKRPHDPKPGRPVGR